MTGVRRAALETSVYLRQAEGVFDPGGKRIIGDGAGSRWGCLDRAPEVVGRRGGAYRGDATERFVHHIAGWDGNTEQR